MNSPRKPDELDGLLMLADAMGNGGSPSRFIEESEKRGQQQFLHSDVIPADVNATDEELTALGFALGEQVEGDKLFRYAKLPDGWKREGTDHSMHSNIVDELGRLRVGVFYKAAWYDRSAHASVYSVSGYVHHCIWEGTAPVIDDEWATREAVIEAATKARDRHLAEAKEWRDGIESGRFQADRVEEHAANDEANAAKWEALRARVAGETSESENLPQPCLLHEGDAHYVQECGGGDA